MIVHREIAIQPHNMKKPPVAISDHRSLTVKAKGPERYVLSYACRNCDSDSSAADLLAANSMSMSTEQVIPISLAQLPQGIGQSAFLLLIAMFNGISPNTVPKAKSRGISSGIYRDLRADYVLPFCRLWPLNSHWQGAS